MAERPADEAEGPAARSARTEALWADTRIAPVEIALPGGVGYTLRAYRPADELAEPDIDPAAQSRVDEFDAASAAVASRRRRSAEDSADPDAADLDAADLDAESDEIDEDADEESGDEEDSDEDDDEGEEEPEVAGEVEDVPIFLGRRGRLLLFHSQEKLVEFVTSDAEHDLSQLDTWPDLVRKLRATDVVPLSDDSYELDLVVENLRGGADAWDASLILKAGEIARDIAFAMRIESVITALAPSSPLDDLDEALRAADAGGVGSFFARRRLRKLPAQQCALGWRTVIGKISTAADWRD